MFYRYFVITALTAAAGLFLLDAKSAAPATEPADRCFFGQRPSQNLTLRMITLIWDLRKSPVWISGEAF